MKPSHPNGQYYNTIQAKSNNFYHTSTEEKEDRVKAIKCGKCNELRGEISHIWEFIRRHTQFGTDVTCKEKFNEIDIEGKVFNAGNTNSLGCDVRNVERIDMAGKGAVMGETDRLLPVEGNSDHGHARSSFLSQSADKGTGPIDLRTQSRIHFQPCGERHKPAKVLRKVALGSGSVGTLSPNATAHTGTVEKVMEQSAQKRGTYLAALLEGGKPLVRDGSADPGSFCQRDPGKNSDMVGPAHKNIPFQPVPALDVHSHRWSRDRPPSRVYHAVETPVTDVPHISIGNRCKNKGDSRIGLRDTFSQTRSNNSSLRRAGQGNYQAGRRPAPGEAPKLGITAPVQRGSCDNSAGTRDAESNQQTSNLMGEEDIFSKYLEDVPHEKVRHTITRTRRTSKVALPVDYNLPLHIKSEIPRMKIEALKSMMNQDAARRFDDTWATLLRLPDSPSVEPTTKSFLPKADIQALSQAGFISQVRKEELKNRPSMDWVIPFTVVESAEDNTERRRFIAWTREDKDRIRENYCIHLTFRYVTRHIIFIKRNNNVLLSGI